MKFVLHEVKLWFKRKNSIPESYYFLPNKINVITGDATTGKTSFWSIIDYCLLGGKMNIANTIVEKVSWFGIRFTINEKEFSIARKSPDVGAVSSEVFLGSETLPVHPTENIPISELKSLLNKEFGITDDLILPYAIEFGKSSFYLSYRYFLLFNSLTEAIIGTPETYFDTTFYGKGYPEALHHIFDLVIGINNTENIRAQNRIQQIDNELKIIRSKENQRQKEDKKTENEIFYLVDKLRENSFIEYDMIYESTDEAAAAIQEVIDQTKITASNSKLFEELDDLNKKRQSIKSQISAISRYRKEFEQYKKSLARSADSLEPIEFLSNRLSDQLIDSYETKNFIDYLGDSLKTIKNSISQKKLEPLKVTGDEQALQSELLKVQTKIDSLEKVKNKFQGEVQKFIVFGEIKNSFEQLLKRGRTKPFDPIKVNQLNEEKANLEKGQNNMEQLRFTRKMALNESIQKHFNQLKSLPTYKNSKTQFDDSKMILQLLPHGMLFPLDNVGSKSNYMFMHLCFYLGLHEHILNFANQHVPQFLFIDQPSIPYYPGEGEMSNDDKTKLIDAFSLLNSFIEDIVVKKGHSFQIFMVEHASKGYWIENKLNHFHTVDEFVKGKGLIPDDIYKN